tara:strand:+ start:29 stop:214 length:186 start_codon:yes stop_codon:yes gene_type:complete
MINQYEIRPAKIVASIFLVIMPITTAIKPAKIFGLSFKSRDPVSSNKIAGNIIAGKIAEGT